MIHTIDRGKSLKNLGSTQNDITKEPKGSATFDRIANTLNCFISPSIDKFKPFFKALKGAKAFQWIK